MYIRKMSDPSFGRILFRIFADPVIETSFKVGEKLSKKEAFKEIAGLLMITIIVNLKVYLIHIFLNLKHIAHTTHKMTIAHKTPSFTHF